VEGHHLEEGKKKSARLGAYLIFCDESGFMLTPTVRRTWAPVGCTPIIRHHFSNGRISVISGISVSPRRKQLGLFGMFFYDNIAQEEVVVFLREVLRHLRGHVIALLDNGSIHKGAPLRELRRRYPRLHIEYFPGYAPDLNPDEAVWKLMKGNLSNGRPDNIAELDKKLQVEFRRVAASQSSLRYCIRQSELPFSLA
jgi:transposase